MRQLENTINSLLNLGFVWKNKISAEQARHVKLVAHRGIHEKNLAKENTLKAFDLCIENQIWGMEFDIRWSKDNVPMIHHDAHLGRLFGRPDTIVETTYAENLKEIAPEIPSLQSVIERYSNKIHMMIEVKEVPTDQQIQLLAEHLRDLKATEDYHLISLKAEALIKLEDHFPRSALMAVAKFNAAEMSQLVIDRAYGAYSGHFIMLKSSDLKRMLDAGVMVGTGFPENLGTIQRELTRGVHWIFTNHAQSQSEALKKLQ